MVFNRSLSCIAVASRRSPRPWLPGVHTHLPRHGNGVCSDRPESRTEIDTSFVRIPYVCEAQLILVHNPKDSGVGTVEDSIQHQQGCLWFGHLGVTAVSTHALSRTLVRVCVHHMREDASQAGAVQDSALACWLIGKGVIPSAEAVR
jgi:hypothetical protein